MASEVSQAKEITWNVINSLLAGALVFLGALTTGHINWESISIAIIASGAVAVTQFKKYWEKEEGEYCSKTALFNFIPCSV